MEQIRNSTPIENPFSEGSLEVRASFSPKTFVEEDRTIEVVFATERPVRRRTWDGDVDEILDFGNKSVRLERLNAGAAILDNHDRWGSVTGVIGVVEEARIENRTGVAKIRFARTEIGDLAMSMVKDGILRSLSVGYAVYAYEKKEVDNGVDTWRAIDWEPFEVSFVGVPADFKATVRSAGAEQKPEEQGAGNKSFIQTKSIHMAEDKGAVNAPVVATESGAAQQPPATSPSATELQAARDAGALAERQRVTTIRDQVRAAGLPTTVADDLIERGLSTESAAVEILGRMAQSTPVVLPNTAPDAAMRGADEVDTRREGMAAALFIRSGGNQKSLSQRQIDLAKDYRGAGLLSMARAAVANMGADPIFMSPMDVAGRALGNSTSDFPVILENVLRQTLLAEYGNVPDSWSMFCATGSVSDFREYKRKRQGALGGLPVVYEGQEYTTESVPDAESNSISAKTYGKLVSITRQMVVNDDLNAFTNIASRMARAAARTVEKAVFDMLVSNPTMGDGFALFSADHNNLIASGSGGVVTVATVDAARVKMALQQDPNGEDYIGLMPKVLVVSTAQGGAARVVNEAQFDVDVSNKFQVPNKSRGLFSTIVDSPRISGNGWYMFADPMQEPVLEVVFLDGVQSPYLEMKEAFTMDGASWKIRLDFGVAPIGFRGAVFNFGS